MTGRRSCLDDSNTLLHFPSSPPQIHHSGRNVFHLLAQREISPRTKCLPRGQWGEAPKQNAESALGLKSKAVRDARNGLFSWVEEESFRHLSAKYCPLVPPPRSTIAAAFSPDGKTLASTHGDHTVKIIDCQSGSCLKVLSGHRRTPWVVRFHPEHPEILASGSLDHEVRLWDANTSECIGSRDFYRPIASIAFHAEGELLAVASGHKLYLWHYNGKGETSSPTIVLKTRRSLRAVHFHPHGAPFLLTAEVNDLDSSDSTMAHATSLGCLSYPPPAVYLANVSNRSLGSSSIQVESSAPTQLQMDTNAMQQQDHLVSPIEMAPVPPDAYVADTSTDEYADGMQSSGSAMDAMQTSEVGLVEGYHPNSFWNQDTSGAAFGALPFNPLSYGVPGSIPSQLDRVSTGLGQHRFLPSRDQTCWALPFLQGWLMGQSQAGMQQMPPLSSGTREYASGHIGVSANQTHDSLTSSGEVQVTSLAMPPSINRSIISGRSDLHDHSTHTRMTSTSEFGHRAATISTQHDLGDSIPIISRIQSELAASLAATAAAELPCTVKLRIWPHNIENPCDPLNFESCRLNIPHAVLCSEMGAHFSPCGRYLAACVACVLPQMEADLGPLTQLNQDVLGAAMSPTRHPISARQVMYELRIYSLEESTFGTVLVSRAIRAAHCLTSIQFSPTSEHILLAYGRRHCSLLKSIVINGETSLPIYTVLEIYRVSDMELVSVLPSAEDEVNVACFHPLAGGGLVYGTKEGKLRVLRYDGSHGVNYTGPNFCPEDNMVEVQTYALEG